MLTARRQQCLGPATNRHYACRTIPGRCRNTVTAAVPPTTASAAPTTPVETLKQACLMRQGNPKAILDAMVALEKAKLKPEASWAAAIATPGARWRLVYTAGSKQVVAAGKEPGSAAGSFFPLAACQVFRAEERSFENGVFFGGVASLTFKGPYLIDGRRLNFDVYNMYIALGPWRWNIPLKKDKTWDLATLSQKERAKLPFFLYAFVDDTMIVARGRSGGLAMWMRADTEWLARSGALAVYK